MTGEMTATASAGNATLHMAVPFITHVAQQHHTCTCMCLCLISVQHQSIQHAVTSIAIVMHAPTNAWWKVQS